MNWLAPAAVPVAEARSTRDSTWAVHRPVRKAALPAAVCGGTVCDGMASYGCDGSSRVGGAARLDKRTGWVVPVDSGGPAPVVVGAADTGDWPMPAATGSTMAAAADGTGPAAGTGNRAVSGPTSI